MENKKYTLILSCGINPPKITPFVKRINLNDRLADHIKAFKEWIKIETIESYIVVDNTGYPLEIFEEIGAEYGKRVETLSFKATDGDFKIGKSHLHTINIEYMIKKSKLIKEATFIIQSSGRYYISKPALLPKMSDVDADIYCIFRDYLTFISATVMIFKIEHYLSFIEKSKRSYLNIDQTYWFEHAAAETVLELIAKGAIWRPLPPLEVRGIKSQFNLVRKRWPFSKFRNKIYYKLTNKVYKRI